MKIHISLSSFKEREQSGFGTCISNEYGRICILTDGPWSPAKHSITDFVVEEAYRGKGHGDALLKEVIRRYKNDIGGQASSKESIKAMLRNGFKVVKEPSAGLEEALKILKEDSSVYLRLRT